MESPHDFHAVHWDHEPVRIPLNRPPGTFSPIGGEGRDEGVRFMGGLEQLPDVLTISQNLNSAGGRRAADRCTQAALP